MDLKEYKNQKYYITDIELKGFKGTKDINNKDGITLLNFDTNLNEQKIILIFAENGKGKSTVLENLHPYADMISRDLKASVEYPAHKIITFQNQTTKIKCEIKWESEKETKGYIYINDKLIDNTEKGNITEYRYLIDKLFVPFNKFKTSLFMQQDILEIVKAKPAERAKIINNFSNPTTSYEDIKEKAVNKIAQITSEKKVYENDIENYKGYENRYEELKKINIEEKQEELQNKKIELQKQIVLQKELEKNKNLNDFNNNALLSIKKKKSLINIENETKNKEKKEKELEIKEKNISSNNIIENSKKIQEYNKLIEKYEKYILELESINNENEFEIEEEKEKVKKIEEIQEIVDNYKHINYLMNEITKIENEIKKINIDETNQNLKTKIEEIEKYTYKVIQGIIQEEVNENNIIDLLINNDIIERYEKNKNIINNLLTIKEHKEEEQKIKEETYNKNIEELNQYDEEKLQINYEKLKEKEYLLMQYNKEKIELENILSNLTDNDNSEYKCKCCNSVLNKEKLENHLKEKIEQIKKIGEVQELKKKVEEDLNKIKFLQDKNKLLYEDILIIKKELKLDKYKDLKEKEEKSNKVIKKIKEIIEMNNSLQKITEEKNRQETELKNKNNELNEFNKLPLDEIKQNSYEFFKNKLNNLKDTKKILEILNTEHIKINSKIELINYFSSLLTEKKEQLKIEEKVVNQYETLIKDIDILKTDLNKINENIKNYANFIKEEEEYKKEIEKISFNLEEYEEKEKRVKQTQQETEELLQEINTYKKDKEFIEKIMEDYIEKQQKINELNKEEMIYQKIKVYSDRIKKAQVSNFFSGITDTINEMIKAEEGSLKHLKVSISQKGNKNLNIKTTTKHNEAADISLLSGAEKSVVSRGISLALAKQHNFGIVYMDESDGKLSQKNKDQFIKTLKKTQQIVGTNQLFIISHNKDLKLLADQIITFD